MKYRYILFGLILVLALAASAQAITIQPNDGWHRFSFHDVGSVWVDAIDKVTPISFDFILTKKGILKVTDIFWAGDQFRVLNNVTPLGDTNFVAANNGITTYDPDFAFADPRWSHAAVALDPGNYSITGIILVSPFHYGGAYLEVITPLPASAILMFSGLLGLAGWRRFRKN